MGEGRHESLKSGVRVQSFINIQARLVSLSFSWGIGAGEWGGRGGDVIKGEWINVHLQVTQDITDHIVRHYGAQAQTLDGTLVGVVGTFMGCLMASMVVRRGCCIVNVKEALVRTRLASCLWAFRNVWCESQVLVKIPTYNTLNEKKKKSGLLDISELRISLYSTFQTYSYFNKATFNNLPQTTLQFKTLRDHIYPE